MKLETVVARAADEGWLQPAEIARIRAQFARVAPQADAFAAAFYQRLFRLAPSVRAMFPDDLAEQQSKLVHMLATLVARLDAPAQLAAPLTRLGEHHHRYGVTRKDFALVGVALLDTLAEHLAAEFDADARHAWRRLYMHAAATMQAASHAAPEDLGWRAAS